MPRSPTPTREGLRVVDLIPAHLDAERALGLLRLLDPAAHRTDRLRAGTRRGPRPAGGRRHPRAGRARHRGAAALESAGPDPPAPPLKEYAPDATGWAIAPGLRSPHPGPRPARRGAARPGPARRRLLAAAQLAGLALLAKCLFVGAALGRGGGRPVLAAARRRASPAAGPAPRRPGPRHRVPAAALPVRRAADPGHPRPAEPPRTRRTPRRAHAAYTAELAAGTDRFFEARRADCPWCGSRRPRRTGPDARPAPGQARPVHPGASAGTAATSSRTPG